MKTTVTALLITTVSLCNITAGAQALTLNKGDEYEKQIFIRSGCTLQQGKYEIIIENSSCIGKTFKVSGVTGKGLSFIITTDKIIDTINAGGQQMIVDSDKGAEAG